MRLNGIFKDNIVFQRDEQIRVFGVADNNAVSVLARILDGDEILSEGIADGDNLKEDGSFVIELDALPAGGPYTLWVDSQVDEITIHNVYIGEVWLAGGQSNMEYPLGRSDNARDVVTNCPVTRMHFYNVPVADTYDEKAAAAEDAARWAVVSADTCYDMTGVGFYFARKVSEYLETHDEEGKDLHFGIVGCYLGGTSVSSWQSVESLKRTPAGVMYLDDFKRECDKWTSDEEYQKAEDDFYNETMEYVARVEKVLEKDRFLTYLQAESLIAQGGPWPPPVGPRSQRRPGALFEAMLMRIVPFAFRGVIFYQGEEDVGKHPDVYEVVFRTMIEEWRELFRDEHMPFLFCQLPVFPEEGSQDYVDWGVVQAQQALAAKTIPDVYMIDIMECGEINNVHPSDKKTPGLRLAALAIKHVYGFDY